jgi:hypothetical protein
MATKTQRTMAVGAATWPIGPQCTLCGEDLARGERGVYCDHPRGPDLSGLWGDEPQRDAYHVACAARLADQLIGVVARIAPDLVDALAEQADASAAAWQADADHLHAWARFKRQGMALVDDDEGADDADEPRIEGDCP